MSDRTFHVLVVAPLRATRDHAIDEEWQAPVRFERATFDEAMATVAPALSIDVPDPTAPGGKPARVDLRFEAMRSFRPDVMMEQVPILKALRAAASYVPPPPEERPREAKGGAGSLVDDILAGMEASPPGGQTGERGRPPTDVVLEAIVSHPEVQRLERAWRGLQLLASRSERDVVVEAIAASADEVDAALERVARRTDAGPIDLIVVDHEVGSSRRDLDRLESWAARAEGIGAPLVANALPEVVGLDDLASVGRTQRRLRSSDDPRAVVVRGVAAREPMRWVALAMNGALARPRHEGPVKRTFGVTLDEREELFLGPAVLVASLCIASFARTGWACAFTGPTNGIVRDLPVRTLDDRGTGVATPLEALVSEEAAAECAAAGITVFASVANSDVAILPYAPVLYRPASASGGASAAASHGLADQLFVARVAQAITQLAAAIRADTPEGAARDVARLTLAELFGNAPKRPEIDVAIHGTPPRLEVVLRPRGFYGVRLEEVTLGAPLG
jgi:hypothetical protein